MINQNKEYSAKQLRIFRFGGVLIFIGFFIMIFIFTGNDFFLRRCLASGNSVKYCNDIYDDRSLVKQNEKQLLEEKIDSKSNKLLFREEIYENGSSYFGQFLNDKPHGFGTLIEQDGNKYIGQWKNGEMHGHGTYIWGPNSTKKILFFFRSKSKKNGDKYIGQWENGEMHGHGIYIWGPNSKKSGDKYVGQWVSGERSGFGKLTFSDGNIYIGEFLNNKRHGEGAFLAPTKEKEFGQWKYGKKI